MPREDNLPNSTSERPCSPTPACADTGSSEVVHNVSADGGFETPVPVGSITGSEEELLLDREGLVDLATGQNLAITGHFQPPSTENAGQWAVHNEQRGMSPCCDLSAVQAIIPQPWLSGDSSLKAIGQGICADLEVAILCMQKRLGKVMYFAISMKESSVSSVDCLTLYIRLIGISGCTSLPLPLFLFPFLTFLRLVHLFCPVCSCFRFLCFSISVFPVLSVTNSKCLPLSFASRTSVM